MEEILQQDKDTFLFLNNLGNEAFDQFWIMVSGTFIWVPFYVILLYLLYKRFGLSNVLYIAVFIALGVTISDQLSGIFKSGIARLRPCHDPSLNHLMREVKCGGQFGFYSAHASNTFFLASFLTFLLKNRYRKLPFILFFWATAVAYSRIYLGVHYPLDILFGATVGFLLGGLMSSLVWKIIKKRELLKIEN
ncbi:MAG: phosphatase PAP2 family protein [Cruoricaptor ignavus]|nr:phosphatase PAP2 family protein [Cruoricaptor ignavus]